MKYKINWKEEADFINTYADSKIKRTKKEVLEYLEMIQAINGNQDFYSNEKSILKRYKHNLKEMGVFEE